jgi:dihydroorotate dehydrogenase (NAD+) catalytic subunit
MDLSAEFCGVRLHNATVLASGILGTGDALMARVARAGAGAVTTKSCSLQPRLGHLNPTVLQAGPVMLNSIGLSNPGVEEEIAVVRRLRSVLPGDCRVIASVFADTVANFGAVARRMCEARPDFLEVNISCPNVEAEFGCMFSADPEMAGAVTSQVKVNSDVPVIVKLSPNVSDIRAIARAVEQAGADAIAAINTVGPGMVIDVGSGRPVFLHGEGGMSGPAILPLAVRCVYHIAQAVNIPIIGMGGISTGADALQLVMAGATAVGIGSAIAQRGIGVFEHVAGELEALLQCHGYSSLAEARGMAHHLLVKSE